MTGTDKQIEWASKIRQTAETMLRGRYSELEALLSVKQADKWAKVSPVMLTAIEALLAEESAAQWIDQRDNCNNAGWINTYLMTVCRKVLS